MKAIGAVVGSACALGLMSIAPSASPGRLVSERFQQLTRAAAWQPAGACGDGAMFHPGGIDFDGQFIWVPVGEYRPDSRSIVYRVDPVTMAATGVVPSTRFRSNCGPTRADR